MRRPLIALLTAPLLACGIGEGLHLEDDLGASDSPNDIHGPYARGTTVTLDVGGWRSGSVDDTWDIVADDGAVLTPLSLDVDDTEESAGDEEEGFTVEFRAVSVGTTQITLVDPSGEMRAQTSVEVVMPDTVSLHVATAERMAMPELASEACGVRIVEGGTGGLVAQYWLDDVEVFGHEVLSLSSDDPVVTDVDYSYTGKNLDWLQLTPEATGTHSVDLLVDGVHLETMTYEAVAADAVVTSALLGADEETADQGDTLELLAQAFDEDDCPVYGARWTWSVDDEVLDDQGDIYRYELDESVNTTLEARFGEQQQTTTVHGVGAVLDSNAASCSAVAGTAAFAPALLGLLALARRRDD